MGRRREDGEESKEGNSEPELERESGACHSSSRLDEESEPLECARTRQQPAAEEKRQSHRCRVRQSLRSHEAAAALRAVSVASAVVGSSMMLNKMPMELLEAVLSCEFAFCCLIACARADAMLPAPPLCASPRGELLMRSGPCRSSARAPGNR